MAHPYASQAKASQKRRLSALGAKAGKSFGSSSMYKASSYPAKGAGSSTPMTISGKAAKKRADRPANHFAGGGFVGGGGLGGGGGKKKSKKGGSTTNIIIASPGAGGGGGARPVPVPIPRPVPVPVRPGLPTAAAAPRPGLPPGAGVPPVNVNVPAPAAPAPMPAAAAAPSPAMRPPGMARGGLIGSTYHNWGKGYKEGGSVKKKASGGPLIGGLGAAGQQAVPARKPFTPGAVPGRRPAAAGATNATPAAGGVAAPSPVVPLTGGRPTRPGYMKKGGNAEHDDEEQDKKLISKMIKKEDAAEGRKAKKYAEGGVVDEQSPPVSSERPPVNFGGQYSRWGTGGSSSLSPSQSREMMEGFSRAYDERPQSGDVSTTRPQYRKGGRVKKYQAGGGVSSEEEDTPAPQASSTTSAAPAASGFGFGDALKGATSLTKSLSAPSASKSDQAARAQSEQNRAADAAKQAAGTTQALASKPIQSGGFKPGEVPGATPQLKPLYKKGGAVKAGSHSGLGRLQKISAARKVPAKTEI